MRAPFPWFGGKSKVAPQVWAALGDVHNYVEPFAGSLAVLLQRPAWHRRDTATVNDLDRYLANFWRAVVYMPDDVAHYADWPVNEADLESRHLWLVNEGRQRLADGMWNNPEWCDPQIAGWWLWGICAWIGGSWCAGNGPHTYNDNPNGVNRIRPHLGDGRGINRQLPELGNAGRGINRQRPHEVIRGYMQALQDKLRHVRVCCGDWQRVVTPGALAHGNVVGVFFDPPYSTEADRNPNLYNHDCLQIAHDVREWCLANGDNPRYRIVLCGYYDEHAPHMPDTWRVEKWKTQGGYGNNNKIKNNDNRHKETIWYSPHCLNPEPTLFELSHV